MGWIASRAAWMRSLRRSTIVLVAAACGLGVDGAALRAADSDVAKTVQHPTISLVEGSYAVIRESGRETLGEVSAYCRSCHGVIGSEDSPVGGGGVHIGAPDRGHPVDLDYPAAAPELIPKDSMDPAIVLLDGKITCLSCHDAAEGGRGLTKPVEQGELCRSCHVK